MNYCFAFSYDVDLFEKNGKPSFLLLKIHDLLLVDINELGFDMILGVQFTIPKELCAAVPIVKMTFL